MAGNLPCRPMIDWLNEDSLDFPPSHRALGADTDAPGLLAAGGTLTPARLEAAYRRGIFPWYSPGCEIRVDFDRAAVLQACASVPREGQHGTWIVPELQAAYLAWPAMHSVETWVDGELAGGLYGVNLGRMFYGESMFMRRTDAAKIALRALVCLCREFGIPWIDCQQNTRHLASLGAAEVPRTVFEAHLRDHVGAQSPGPWTYHHRHWH